MPAGADAALHRPSAAAAWIRGCLSRHETGDLAICILLSRHLQALTAEHPRSVSVEGSMGVHLVSRICTMLRYKSKYVTARMLSCASRNSSSAMSSPARGAWSRV